jgi:hypothetical protein
MRTSAGTTSMGPCLTPSPIIQKPAQLSVLRLASNRNVPIFGAWRAFLEAVVALGKKAGKAFVANPRGGTWSSVITSDPAEIYAK